jgi:hypothetical protein
MKNNSDTTRRSSLFRDQRGCYRGSHWVFMFGMLGAMIGFIGCQPKETVIEKHFGPNPTDQLPVPPSSENPQGGIDGGGGGNGFAGESLEHWRVDLNLLPSYKVLKVKVIDSLALRFPKLAGDIFHLIERRRWYLIPTELRNLPASKIGVYFNTEQMALQGLDEIWINDLLFSKMDLEGQAILLLHEFLMGVRLLEFVSLFDLCLADISFLKILPENAERYSEERHQCFKRYRDISELDGSIGLGKNIKLEDHDYFSIRSFTSLLMKDAETFNVQELADEMRIRRFRKYSP